MDTSRLEFQERYHAITVVSRVRVCVCVCVSACVYALVFACVCARVRDASFVCMFTAHVRWS